MLKKILAIIALIIMACFVLAGCGDASTGKNNDTNSTSTEVESTDEGEDPDDDEDEGDTFDSEGNVISKVKTSKASKASTSKGKTDTSKKTIKIWGFNTDDSIKAAIKNFEKANPNVKVKLDTPADYSIDAVKRAIATGTQPDMVMLDHVYITGLGRSGDIIDLVPLGANSIKDVFIQSCWEGASYNGKVYGLPSNGNTIALMYNKKMMDDTGMSVPKNYDQLKAVAQKMMTQNTGKWAFTAPFFDMANQGRKNWTTFNFLFWLWGNGGDVLNSDYTQAAFNSQAGIDAMNQLIGLVNDGLCNGEKYLEQEFYNGDVGMIEMGCWSIPTLTDKTKAAQLSVTTLPELKAGVPSYSGLGLYTWGITAKTASDLQPICYEFLKSYVTNTSWQVQYAKKNNALPVTKEARNNSFFTSSNAWDTFLKQYETVKARPGVTNWIQIEDYIAEAINNALSTKNVPSALNTAANKVNGVLK